MTAALLTRLLSTAALPAGGLALGKLAMPTGPQLGQVPGWAWLGGFLRVLLILAQLDASPAIGAATFLWIIVTVGVLTSLVLDHFGWIGFRLHRASAFCIAGAVLMVISIGFVAGRR
ncbi:MULTISPECIES: DMT family transporter [Methylorubrum]|uniref:DMT family transporter n=1 Tax=Methylorubrum TaxID=2282523 RepID=UPI00209F3172|nr:transporter family-2 protein [Methylorubrum zatmanii]MCP1553879.1 transporter family-2 protein [Methylorubrum extorquens]MCP1579810.1 transporter family-2 protein [Methylorubrum extorquens]